MLFLSTQDHIEVLKNLIALGRPKMFMVSPIKYSNEYTSLMVSFLLHNISASESLLTLYNTYSNQWFPTNIGYIIVRTMFETDITAHYITKDPTKRSLQYIQYGAIIDKKQLAMCINLCNSTNNSTKEYMQLMFKERYKNKEEEINNQYNKIKNNYTHNNKNGKKTLYKNWSGKSIHNMAIEVDHKEVYETLYTELSSFTHVDVKLATRFLRVDLKGPYWSNKASENDLGSVFQYADIFLTCFLKLFGKEMTIWDEEEVDNCWNIKKRS